MELPFLNYINNPETKWIVCIGVPYGSHIWQVADSSEVNGTYKMNLTKAKQWIYDLKSEHYKVWKPTDIIPICHMAFDKSFAIVENVKKAICQRGWHPLNYALLLHPDLLASKRLL